MKLASILFVLLPELAVASGSGIAALASPFVNDAPGERHPIWLKRSKGLLVGRPDQGAVALLEVYAPSCEESLVIVREARSSDVTTRYLQFVTSDCVQQNLKTAAIYFREDSFYVCIAAGGRWKPIAASGATLPIRVARPAERSSTGAGALGLFRLTEAPPTAYPRQIDNALLDAGVDRRNPAGLLHIALPISILLVCMTFSKWDHRRSARRGK